MINRNNPLMIPELEVEISDTTIGSIGLLMEKVEELLDTHFGKGYAEKNPALLGQLTVAALEDVRRIVQAVTIKNDMAGIECRLGEMNETFQQVALLVAENIEGD